VSLGEILGGPPLVDAVVKYLYTTEYPTAPTEKRFSHHIQMCVFADRHDIPDLLQRASDEYATLARESFLQKIDIPDFAAAVILIYQVFPKRGLLHDITETLAVSMADQLFLED
jgi:hypothetical protein